MRRGTTPTFYLYVKGADLSHKKIFVTIQQGGRELTIEDPSCEKTDEGCILKFTLTQEETLGLKKGEAGIQIRWIDNTNRAAASVIKQIIIGSILKDGEIDYE